MIRRALLIAGFCSLAAQAGAQDAFVRMSGAGREIDITRLTPNIVQFTVRRDSYVRMLNCTAVITDRDVILFDSLTRPSSAEIVIHKLREITDKPIRIVINSHAHPDHWSGTPAFAKAFPGLDVIASEQTDHFMHLMASVWAKRIAGQVEAKRKSVSDEQALGNTAAGAPLAQGQLAMDKRDLVDLESLADEFAHETRIFPTIIYRGQLRLRHAGEQVELSAVSGDQEGTTIAYLPKEKVLLTGDLVSYPMPYLNTHPSQQLAALKRIDAMDFAILVPGHGPAMRDHRFLKLEIALIEAAIEGVRREVALGDADLPTVQSRIVLDSLRPQFTGGDADLDSRFTARVKDLVRFTFLEMTGTG